MKDNEILSVHTHIADQTPSETQQAEEAAVAHADVGEAVGAEAGNADMPRFLIGGGGDSKLAQSMLGSVLDASPVPATGPRAEDNRDTVEGAGNIVIRDMNGGEYVVSEADNTVRFTLPPKSENQPPRTTTICSYLLVTHKLIATGGDGRWAEVEFYDEGGRRKVRKVSLDPSEIIADTNALARAGLAAYTPTSTRGSKIADYVQAAAHQKDMPYAWVVTREGWLDRKGRYFSMGGEIIKGAAAPARNFRKLSNESQDWKIGLPTIARVNCSLAEWQEHLGCFLPYSLPLRFAVCVALSGCLVELFGDAINPIVHFFGDRGCGKSSIARAAATIWGGDLGTCNMARVGGETLIAMYDGFCAVMDEATGDGKSSLIDLIYTVANGHGRVAANTKRELLPVRRFAQSMITTGEMSISDTAKKARKRMTTGGEESRAISYKVIPSGKNGEYGIFDNPPKGKRPGTLFRDINEACASGLYRGAVGRQFIQCLTNEIAEKGIQALRKQFDEFYESFIALIPESETMNNPAQQREFRIFARIAFAGKKAEEYGVLKTVGLAKDVAKCAEYCAGRDTTIEARLDACVADAVNVVRARAYRYDRNRPQVLLEPAPRPYDVICNSLIVSVRREESPGKVDFIETPLLAAYNQDQLKDIADRRGCSLDQFSEELKRRGIVYLGRTDFQPTTGYVGFGLSHNRRYAIILMNLVREGRRAGKADMLEARKILNPNRKPDDAQA